MPTHPSCGLAGDFGARSRLQICTPAPSMPRSYHRLFTVNATCTAPDKAKYGAVLDEIVKSFRPPPVAIV